MFYLNLQGFLELRTEYSVLGTGRILLANSHILLQHVIFIRLFCLGGVEKILPQIFQWNMLPLKNLFIEIQFSFWNNRNNFFKKLNQEQNVLIDLKHFLPFISLFSSKILQDIFRIFWLWAILIFRFSNCSLLLCLVL